MLVPRAQARIDGQLRDGDALDTKTLGVLGLDTAAVALLVAVRDSLNALWWIPACALGVTGVLLLAAIWPRTFDLGPDPRKFYEAMGTSSRLVATRQMLSELLKVPSTRMTDSCRARTACSSLGSPSSSWLFWAR